MSATAMAKDRVAQIITFGSFLARGVLRNVGRVLEMPLGLVDKLAKLAPQNPAAPVSLKQAIESEPRLKEAAEQDSRVRRMLEIAQKLEGLYSNASTHAAGVVIGDRPLDQLVPLYRDPKSDMPATQFNMKWVEQAGLVKFDFLGLKTLTTLATCVALLKQRGIEVDLATIALDDQKTFDMLGRGETIGVFQVESAGHAQGAGRNARRPLRGHYRAGGALPSRPDGQYPDLLRGEARRGGRRLPPSQDRSRC